MNSDKASNITWHAHQVTQDQREKLLEQKGVVVWFTGLSGSGKSTIANELAHQLHTQGKLCYVLDGDNIRHGLNKNLGFSAEDRKENIRRISEVASLFVDAGIITLTAFISPYKEDRAFCRTLVGKNRFIEIYVTASLETCEKRDPKGLYKKARVGDIQHFTGITAPYEPPEHPDLIINTDTSDVYESAELVLKTLQHFGCL